LILSSRSRSFFINTAEHRLIAAPLRYRFTDTGCAVYSVSMDLEDNGGTPLGRYRSWNTSGDQPIEMRDSKYRAAMAHNAQGQNDR